MDQSATSSTVKLPKIASLNFRIRPTIINGVFDALSPNLSEEKRALLADLGVSHFLNFPSLNQNVVLMQKLLDLWREEQVGFEIKGRIAKFSVEEVALIIGMPNRGQQLKMQNNAPLHPEKTQKWRDDLKKIDPASSTEEFGILFVNFLITNVFFVPANYKISSFLITNVNNFKDFCNYNWPEAIHSHLISQFSNYSLRRLKGEGPGYISGFVTVLFIWFLERSNALKPNLPNTRPRLLRWVTEKYWRSNDLDALFARIEINEGFQAVTNEEKALLVNSSLLALEGSPPFSTPSPKHVTSSSFPCPNPPPSLYLPSPTPPPPPPLSPNLPMFEEMLKNQNAMLARIVQLEEENCAILARLAKLEDKQADATKVEVDDGTKMEDEAAAKLDIEAASKVIIDLTNLVDDSEPKVEDEAATSKDIEAATKVLDDLTSLVDEPKVEEVAATKREFEAANMIMNLSQTSVADVSIAQAVKGRDDRRKLVVWTPLEGSKVATRLAPPPPPPPPKKRKRSSRPKKNTSKSKKKTEVAKAVEDLPDIVKYAPLKLDFMGRSQVGEETLALMDGFFEKFRTTDDVVLQFGERTIFRSHVDEIIMDAQFVDVFIDAFVAVLFHRLKLPDCEYFAHSIYLPADFHYYQTRGIDPSYLCRHVTKDIVSQSEYLFFPINEGNHWVLGVGLLQEEKWCLYDSVPYDHHLAYLKEGLETLHLYASGAFSSDVRSWPIELMMGRPKQDNNIDCGAFVCKYIEVLASTKDVDWSTMGDWNAEMLKFRVQMASDLFTHSDVHVDMPTYI